MLFLSVSILPAGRPVLVRAAISLALAFLLPEHFAHLLTSYLVIRYSVLFYRMIVSTSEIVEARFLQRAQRRLRKAR